MFAAASEDIPWKSGILFNSSREIIDYCFYSPPCTSQYSLRRSDLKRILYLLTFIGCLQIFVYCAGQPLEFCNAELKNAFFTADGRRWTQIRADRVSLSGYGIDRHIRTNSMAIHLSTKCTRALFWRRSFSFLAGDVSGRKQFPVNSRFIWILREAQFISYQNLSASICVHLRLQQVSG